MKICSICNLVKPESDFYTVKQRKGPYVLAQCKSCHSQACIQRARDLRLKVISHYTNGEMKCSRCLESRTYCLDIDHVNNDGNIHRKAGLQPRQLCELIIRNNYPSNFQVLCKNCNWEKQHLLYMRPKSI
jgi:hypothetical protein